MVTREVEKGVLKCHRYWPDGDIGASQSYGSITVTLTAVEPKDTFTQRHFAIALGDAKPRTIMQLCFDSWPDHVRVVVTQKAQQMGEAHLLTS